MSIIFAIAGMMFMAVAGWKLGRQRGYEDRMAEELRRYSGGKYGK